MIDRHDAEHELNIALLIDADNASPDHLDEVLLVLGELGTINIRRAYGNWSKTSLKRWGELSGKHSIIPVQQFDVVKGKSATDMRMVIDAMDLLYRGHVDGFGIMSSDSDFLPLAQRIREDGLQVYGFGTAKTPQSFQQACSRFFDVAALADDGGTANDNAVGKPGEALKLLEGDTGSAGMELRGDALLATGKREEARDAYAKALAATDVASPARRRVELKLQEAGGEIPEPVEAI